MIATKFSVSCYLFHGETGNKAARMIPYIINFFVKLVPDIEVFNVLNTAFMQKKIIVVRTLNARKKYGFFYR